MDLIGGLSAAKLALDLAKDLRQIDRSADEASFKLKLADLTAALADTQVALAEARVLMIDKDAQIRELEGSFKDATAGDLCPKCRAGRLSLIKSNAMSMGVLGRFGVEEWDFACGNSECDFETTKVQDPQGLVAKFVAKR